MQFTSYGVKSQFTCNVLSDRNPTNCKKLPQMWKLASVERRVKVAYVECHGRKNTVEKEMSVVEHNTGNYKHRNNSVILAKLIIMNTSSYEKRHVNAIIGYNNVETGCDISNLYVIVTSQTSCYNYNLVYYSLVISVNKCLQPNNNKNFIESTPVLSYLCKVF